MSVEQIYDIAFAYRNSALETIGPGTFAGFFVMLSTFAVPLCYSLFRKDLSTLVTLWSLLFVYHSVALINSFHATTFGAGADARAFYNNAVDIAFAGDFELLFGAGSTVYENFLGVLYFYLGPSVYLASELSVLAFLFSCVYLVKTAALIGLYDYRRWILIFFGVLPTMWLLSSIPMREAYQYLFFLLTVYFGIKMHLNRDLRLFPLVLLFAVCMGLFHKGLVLFMVPLVLIVSFFTIEGDSSRFERARGGRYYHVFLYSALSAVVFSVVVLVVQRAELLHDTPKAVISGEAFEYVREYREGGSEHRATYGIDFEDENPLVLTSSLIKMVFYYFFYPFPWVVQNLMDVYAVIEIFWRAVLIFSSCWLVYTSRGDSRRIYMMLLTLFFVNSFIWAVGTKNYGTAIRHHLVPYWIIVLLGTPFFVEYVKSKLRFLKSP